MKKDDLWCHYSDLPSPMAYSIPEKSVETQCTDYDGMGDQSRFPPKVKKDHKFLGRVWSK